MFTSSHPILLAALDLDGTLLNSNGEVSPYTQKVLSEASDRGVVVIPATGRPLASLPPVVAKQPWVHYALTSNGAAVWDLGGDPLGCVYSRYANAAEHETSQPECIVRRCFPVEKAREVYEAFHGLPGGLNIFSDGRALRDTAQQRFFDERFARLAAVKERCPVTIFLISGIFPLVPGAGVYWTVYYMVTDQLYLAVQTGYTAVKVAVAIVLGIVFVFELPQGLFRALVGRRR